MIIKEKWPFNKRDVSSAWKGLEDYIIPIIKHFNIQPTIALEFGVDLGYSSDIFSQVFKNVIGVDGFLGDSQIVHKQGDDFYNKVKQSFNNTNVTIIRSLYQDFIKQNNDNYDLIHIDIIHEYEPTFECAEWSILHSNIVILHDTESYAQVKQVCLDIANKHNLNFYNIPEHFGLGILHKV
jgi:hypothetical protein